MVLDPVLGMHRRMVYLVLRRHHLMMGGRMVAMVAAAMRGTHVMVHPVSGMLHRMGDRVMVIVILAKRGAA